MGECEQSSLRGPVTSPAAAKRAPPALQFNLEVEEVEVAAKALDRWRRETGLPMVLEVRAQETGSDRCHLSARLAASQQCSSRHET